MKVGFTGTREGLTEYQRGKLAKVLSDMRDTYSVFVHGDCVGADEQAHRIAKSLGYIIEVYPPKNPRLRAFCEATIVHEPDDYLSRNRKIVDTVDFLIACPKQEKEILRSGTWATVRYARKRGKEVLIICPECSEEGCSYG